MASIFKRSRKKGEPYLIQYLDHQDKRQTVKGFTDKGLTEELAKRLEGEARLRRTGLVDTKQEKFANEQSIDIELHLTQFEESLSDNSQKHVALTMFRIRRLLSECAIARLSDVDAEHVRKCLQKLRESEDLGHRTYNHYLQALDSFLNWCVRTGRMLHNPLQIIERLNVETDIRHKRRALTLEEFDRLLTSVAKSGRPYQCQSSQQRIRIYTIAYLTGLRKQELASLTRNSFKLDDTPATLTVEAKRSKHRKKDVLPLHPQLVTELREWTRHMGPTEKLFPDLGEKKLSDMIRLDLRDANIPYENSDGIADFHAAGRHTYITQLIRSGVPLPTAMKLARHSDVRMTMRYTHIGIDDQAKALESLPPPSVESALQMRCISGGAGSHHVALSATKGKCTSKKKRSKSKQESDFGASCHNLAVAIRAEGTGLEPATPYGALHFQ